MSHTLESALELDHQDPLRHMRKEFHLPLQLSFGNTQLCLHLFQAKVAVVEVCFDQLFNPLHKLNFG